MSYFIVQFPLKTEKYQEDILDKRFEIGRQIYNSLVNITQKRYREMIKTREYRNLISQLSGDKRDLYSAFLIMNVAEDLKSFNINKCN